MCPPAGSNFAIGELTQEDTEGLHSKTLAEVLERMQRGRTGSTEGIAAEMRHGLTGVDEIEPVALEDELGTLERKLLTLRDALNRAE